MELTMFWQEVIEAYNQVAVNNERRVKVARDGKQAIIATQVGAEGELDLGVVIIISSAATQTVEPLVEP